MKLKDFDYYLPKNLIAEEPIKPRDQSRLLVLNKKTGGIEHKRFYNIMNYLQVGDVLVLNNSKVFPARLIGKKIPTGGKAEVFLLQRKPPLSLPLNKGEKERGGEVWQCLIGGKGRKENLEIKFSEVLIARILKDNGDGTWNVKFNKRGKELMKVINQIGLVPLPPYIKRLSNNAYRKSQKNEKLSEYDDKINYQTVYAKKVGSVAAPTAGFHFTPGLLKKIKNKGVLIEYVTLHVGLGTFAPVKVDDIRKHKMHEEWVEVKASTIRRIQKAKIDGRRIIAVGTTSVRTLESFFKKLEIGNLKLGNKENGINSSKFQIPNFKFQTNIFIYPGYKFKIVDAMITNFHLPKSTLLMLVMAFACTAHNRRLGTSTTLSAGRKNIIRAYEQAIKKKYRFYSYGDAMFIY